MFKKLLASGVALLAVGAGVAYAATQTGSSDGNQVNGLMRASTACREAEYPLTIGGDGGTVQVRSGTFSDVGWGTTSVGVTLPLTGVTLAGRCQLQPANPAYNMPDTGLARLLV